MTQQKPDLYAVLCLDKTATVEQIERAAKMVIATCHPDRVKNLPQAERAQKEQRYKDAVTAKEILTDSTKRAAYDRGGHAAVERLQNANSGGGTGHYSTSTTTDAAGPRRTGLSFSDLVDEFGGSSGANNTAPAVNNPSPSSSGSVQSPTPTQSHDAWMADILAKRKPPQNKNAKSKPPFASPAPLPEMAPEEVLRAEAALRDALRIINSGIPVPLDALNAFRQNLSDALAATDRRIAAVKPQPPRPSAP